MPECAMEGGLAVVGYEGLNVEGQTYQVLSRAKQLGDCVPDSFGLGTAGKKAAFWGQKAF